MKTKTYLVANRFVDISNKYNEGKPESEKIKMNCRRINKLLYFCNAYNIYRGIEPMIEDPFYAWSSGPTIPELNPLYYSLKPNIFDEERTRLNMVPINTGDETLTDEELDTINKIFELTRHIPLIQINKISQEAYDDFYTGPNPRAIVTTNKPTEKLPVSQMIHYYRQNNILDELYAVNEANKEQEK